MRIGGDGNTLPSEGPYNAHPYPTAARSWSGGPGLRTMEAIRFRWGVLFPSPPE